MNTSRGDGIPTGPSNLGPILIFSLGDLLILTLLAIPLKPHRKQTITTLHASSATAAPPRARQAEAVVPHHAADGHPHIYLVQVGTHFASSSLDDLALWMHTSCGLDVHVLSPLALDPNAYDPDRKQYISQFLNDQLKRDLPMLAVDPNAYIIGFTDAPMYNVSQDSEYTYTERDQDRRAIISIGGLTPPRYLADNPAQRTSALHRILLRDVAILAWKLPLNHNPQSILAADFDAYAPGEQLLTTDLHPETTQYGRYVSDPCVVFAYRPATANQPAELKPLPGEIIQECANLDEPSADTEQERFQVRLRYGLLIDRRTDFSMPGVIPIHFERETDDQLTRPLAFGMSGSNNYDEYLATFDGMRHIGIASVARADEMLTRRPTWLPFLAFNNWVDEGSGRAAVLGWHGGPQEHFDLTRYTGDVSSYLPCNDSRTLCYLNGFHNAHGDALVFERNADRNLTRLTSPTNDSIVLTYDDSKRISEIADNRGRQVRYRYNDNGMLVGISYPSGETLTYTFDSARHLLTFSATADAHTASKLLLTNEYAGGRLSRQILANGDIYQYSYGATDKVGLSRQVSFVTPDGKTLNLNIGDHAGAIISQRP